MMPCSCAASNASATCFAIGKASSIGIAPRAIRSDMGGTTLLGVAAGTLLGGSGTQIVLKPSGGVTLSDGGAGLIVSDQEKERAVRRFLRG